MKVISQYIVSKKNAGPKAKVDIERILQKEYNARIFTNKVTESKANFLSRAKKFLFLRKNLKTDDIVVIQIPFSNKVKFLNLADNKIGLVHDLERYEITRHGTLKRGNGMS